MVIMAQSSMQKWEWDGDSRCYEKRRSMHGHYDKSFYKVWKNRAADFNAMPQNKFRILSAHLTSCVAGDIKVPGKLSKFWFPPTKNFCVWYLETIMSSSGKDPFMYSWAFLFVSERKMIHFSTGSQTDSYTGLECTGEVMVRGIRGGRMTDKE